ncbi:unnamed protein product [Meloidogyne enterolobii]|uniref:Uncharacterized protein n=2 Tax=Meloidogyne enterolobii TaxID=390850 RepID=A0ACB0Z4M6_MELEN
MIFCNIFFRSLLTFTIIFLLILTLINAKSSNCFYLPSIALNGGTYDEFNAPEIKQCCIACARDPCCIAYTFDEENHRCFMKSAISNSFKNTGMTSGLKANTHHGLGAFLKNIKIHGGTASVKVNLPNNEDCMQYCTAYGIYSWNPLPPIPITTTPNNLPTKETTTITNTSPQFTPIKLPSDEESSSEIFKINNLIEEQQLFQKQGECVCMARIAALEYSFGSRSAIFPPVSSLNL